MREHFYFLNSLNYIVHGNSKRWIKPGLGTPKTRSDYSDFDSTIKLKLHDN